MDHNELTVVEHVEEIRKRLIAIVICFAISIIIGLFISKPLIHYLQYSDHAKSLQLHAFKVTDPVKIFFQVDFIIALILTMPLILYHVWAFVSPGLYDKERKATRRYIPYIFLLFLLGILFSYKVLFPYILKFMMALSADMNVEQTIGISEYFTFLIQITIPFGIVFQLPVIMHFIARIGLISPIWMAKVRKYAYFLLLVIAAIITPPDLISHMMVTIPLCLLYEFSIWIAKLGYRQFLKAERKRLKELGIEEAKIDALMSQA